MQGTLEAILVVNENNGVTVMNVKCESSGYYAANTFAAKLVVTMHFVQKILQLELSGAEIDVPSLLLSKIFHALMRRRGKRDALENV